MENLNNQIEAPQLDNSKLWMWCYLTKPMKVFVTKLENESQIKLFVETFPDKFEGIIDKTGTYLKSLNHEYPFTIKIGEYYVRDYENDKMYSLTQRELDSMFYKMPEDYVDPSLKEHLG